MRVTDEQRRDGQTDGQNYDSQDRASIAASRGKNRKIRKRNGNKNRYAQKKGSSQESVKSLRGKWKESVVGRICETGRLRFKAGSERGGSYGESTEVTGAGKCESEIQKPVSGCRRDRDAESWFQRLAERWSDQLNDQLIEMRMMMLVDERVTRDEERVLQGGWTVMRLCRYQR